jgi:hypothetical protein
VIKEFLPAIEWLEQDYDFRDEASYERGYQSGWRAKPRYNPDGTCPHPERDANLFRRGPYQIIDMPMCGEYLADICEEDTGVPCTHGEHQEHVKCWCLNSPSFIQGLPWTKDDEKEWLEAGNYTGHPARFSIYLRTEHPYLFDHNWDDRPNDIHFWKEEEESAAAA